MKSNQLMFFLIIFLFLNSCDSEEDEVNINDIIQLEISPTKMGFADGNSVFVLEGIIPDDASEDKRKIKFTTTAGKFESNGEQEIEIVASIHQNEGKLKAIAKLIAPTSKSTADITVRILDTFLDDKIDFETASPTNISITNDVPAISSTFDTDLPVEVFLEATVFSSTGLASTGTKVVFDVFNELNEKIPNPKFRNSNMLSNSEGKVSTYLSIGNTNPVPQFLKVVFTIDGTSNQAEVIIDVF